MGVVVFLSVAGCTRSFVQHYYLLLPSTEVLCRGRSSYRPHTAFNSGEAYLALCFEYFRGRVDYKARLPVANHCLLWTDLSRLGSGVGCYVTLVVINRSVSSFLGSVDTVMDTARLSKFVLAASPACCSDIC